MGLRPAPHWRIDVVREGEATLLVVSGRLPCDGAAELARIGRGLAGPFAIDLGGLAWTDNAGAATLRRLRSEGAELRRARPYVSLLVEAP